MSLSKREKLAVGVCSAGVACAAGVTGYWIWEKLRSNSNERQQTGYNVQIMRLQADIRALTREIQELKKVVAKHYSDDQRPLKIGAKKPVLNHVKSVPLVSDEDTFEDSVDWYPTTNVPPGPLTDGVKTDDDKSLEKLFADAELAVTSSFGDARERVYLAMEEQYEKYKLNPEFLWRYSRSCYFYSHKFVQTDMERRKKFLFHAKDLAFEALALEENSADVHRWCAITLGALVDFVPTNQKIENGFHFREHLDKALSLTPENPVLHHLLGRWCFGVSELSWIERKVATTLFGDMPSSSYDQALEELMLAERLKTDGGWIENKLYVAKCLIALSRYGEASKWLKEAGDLPIISEDDEAAHKEIVALATKYDGYS